MASAQQPLDLPIVNSQADIQTVYFRVSHRFEFFNDLLVDKRLTFEGSAIDEAQHWSHHDCDGWSLSAAERDRRSLLRDLPENEWQRETWTAWKGK